MRGVESSNAPGKTYPRLPAARQSADLATTESETERGHFMNVGDVRVHWVELGETTDQVPVVLLHGLNNSHRTWKDVAPLLAKGRRVLMPDLAGHGRSERPDASYTLEWHASIMASWLRNMGLERFDIVGHSFGGGVAQMLLLELPERVRRVVLVASGGLGKDVGWLLRLASLPRVIEALGQPFMALGTRLALRSAQSGVSREDIAELSAFNSLPGSARAFARTLRDVIDWRGQRRTFFQRVHELGQLPPVLVLWGDRDTLIPLAQGEEFAQRMEGSVFERFDGCSHYLHNEKTPEFAATVARFLAAVTMAPVRLRAPRRDRALLFRMLVAAVARLRGLVRAGRPRRAT